MCDTYYAMCTRHHSNHHHRPNQHNNKECKNKIEIENNISVTQSATANGGNGGNGGEGGYGGAAVGGAVTAAGSTHGNAIAVSVSKVEGETDGYDVANENLPKAEKENLTGPPPVPNDNGDNVSISASGGYANAGSGGYGGDGGAGGAGGYATNKSRISVENVVIINCDGKKPHHGSYSLGTNGKKLNITVDEDGNTLVNGKKLDEEELEDGTKVLIFRNSETKYS